MIWFLCYGFILLNHVFVYTVYVFVLLNHGFDDDHPMVVPTFFPKEMSVYVSQ